MGKALLGHKAGERVTVTVNDKVSYDVIIKNIENTEDDDVELNKF